MRNGLIFFSVKNSEITKVSNLNMYICLQILLNWIKHSYLISYKWKDNKSNDEMLRWIEACHSKGLNINPLRKLSVKHYSE